MRWSELADDLSQWALAGSRMKAGRPHDVHLSEAARAILHEIPRVKGCDFVLSTTGRSPISGISKAKTMLDRAIIEARAQAAEKAGCEAAPLVPWRLHDLRRTGVTTLARLGFDSIVVDKLLAHQPAKLAGVAAVYQRYGFGRERAAALDAWAAHVLERDRGNIVWLRA